MIYTMSTVLQQSRTLLNDDAAATYPDPVLIPKIQLAHQELQTALWDAGSPSVRATSTPINVPNGTLNMSGILPADYLTAFALMEGPANNGPWTPMTEVLFITSLQLSGIVAGTTLKYWCNQQDGILFLGSTNTVWVILNYRRAIPIPVASTDSLGVPYAEQYLSYRAAAMAGGAQGDPNSLTTLTAMSKENLAKVISANRGKQTAIVKS